MMPDFSSILNFNLDFNYRKDDVFQHRVSKTIGVTPRNLYLTRVIFTRITQSIKCLQNTYVYCSSKQIQSLVDFPWGLLFRRSFTGLYRRYLTCLSLTVFSFFLFPLSPSLGQRLNRNPLEVFLVYINMYSCTTRLTDIVGLCDVSTLHPLVYHGLQKSFRVIYQRVLFVPCSD